MQGELREFTMAELLQLFALAEQTGTLLVTTADGSSSVQLESGRVIGIGTPELDVHKLLQACELMPTRAGATISEIVPTRQAPGLSFVVRNVIEPERWELFARRCIEQLVYPFLSQDEGTFEATIGRHANCPLTVSLSVQQLVLDGSRWQSEMEEHLDEGYRPSTRIMRLDDSPGDGRFSTLEWLIWAALDRPQSIGRLARRLGIPDLDAIDAARRLLTRGTLQRATSSR